MAYSEGAVFAGVTVNRGPMVLVTRSALSLHLAAFLLADPV